MDRLESIVAFVAVAKAGGFSAAAREMGVPLATVSRRVAELETALGVRLLHRSTRQVALTEGGQNYFSTCQRVLEDLKDADQAVTGEYRTPKGDLSVTAPSGFGRIHVQPVALEFLAAYPDINLNLLLVDRVVDLVEEHIDAALRIASLPESNMIARPIGSVSMIVTASPLYLKRRGIPRHPAELADHDCIAWAAAGPLTSWWFGIDGIDRTFPIRARLATNSAEAALAAAQSGLGVVQTTCYQAEPGLRDGTLEMLLCDFECALTPVNLVYASNRLVPLKLRAFIDFMVPRLTDRLRIVGETVGAARVTPSS